MRIRSRSTALLAVILLAALLRALAVTVLPVDFDEPVYLQAAYDYADAFRAGDLDAIVNSPLVREHPPLQRLLFGAAVWLQGPGVPLDAALLAARIVSAVFGVLAVAFLALFDPVAGGLLAVHTLAVKYTSQVYLEALPLAASIAAVLALVRYNGRDQSQRPVMGWLWLSAVALGVTAAGKWTYLPVIFPILYLLWAGRVSPLHLFTYAAVAVLVMFALDPMLWPDPAGRVLERINYHLRYSEGLDVTRARYPWYQPLVWLSTSPAAAWHPTVFFYFGFDGLMFLLALVGLPRDWRERRWLVVWLLTGIAVLLLWNTKWPQYTLAVASAVCLGAAGTLRRGAAWLRAHEDDFDWLRGMSPDLSPAFWAVLALMGAGLLVGYGFHRADLAAGQRGWSHMTTAGGQLPSNTAHALARAAGGAMLVGTDNGLAVWTPGASAGEVGVWETYRRKTSPLPDDRVLALAVAPDGDVWIGTERGAVRVAGGRFAEPDAWQVFAAHDMGLASGRVLALAAGPEGEIWVGTDAGAARFAAQSWRAFTSELPSPLVNAIAVAPDAVWLGTRAGLARLDRSSGAWETFTPGRAGKDRPAVADVESDAQGNLWAGTLGGGLARYDGAGWRTYVTSNSGLPLNGVQALYAGIGGDLWIGTAFAAQPGGVLARLHLPGEEWSGVGLRRSGFSGSEPLDLIEDGFGRLWIATRTAGVDIYDPTTP